MSRTGGQGGEAEIDDKRAVPLGGPSSLVGQPLHFSSAKATQRRREREAPRTGSVSSREHEQLIAKSLEGSILRICFVFFVFLFFVLTETSALPPRHPRLMMMMGLGRCLDRVGGVLVGHLW